MNVIVEENFELSKDYDNIVTHIHTYSYTRRFRPNVFRYWHDLMFCGLYHGNNFAILIHKFMFRLHPFGMWTSIWHRFLAAPNAVAMGSADSFQTIGSSLFIVSLKWILPNNEQLSIDLCDSSDQHLSILYSIYYSILCTTEKMHWYCQPTPIYKSCENRKYINNQIHVNLLKLKVNSDSAASSVIWHRNCALLCMKSELGLNLAN